MNEEKRSLALRRMRATDDQVRVAYGAVPMVLDALPADDPFRIAIRDRARSFLAELGYLTAEELDTLPVTDALAAARRRNRAEIHRTDRAPGRASKIS